MNNGLWFVRAWIVILAMQWGITSAETENVRGVERIGEAKAVGPALSDHYSSSHALLIGVSAYEDSGWSPLPSIDKELASVRSMLLRAGFDVETASNLSGRELQNTLYDFVAEKGYDENNRLLIYFAGHGETVELSKERQMGYFVPADAPTYASDPRGFVTRALSMNRVMSVAKEIRSKHAMFVFDSCFSGSLFQTRSFGSTNGRSLEFLLEKPVRYFITSGSADETVPSNSVFTRAFVDAFETGAADLNRDGYVTSTELGLHLTQNVRLGNQTPQHGKINNYSLSQGDVVFDSLAAPVANAQVSTLSPEQLKSKMELQAELRYWEAVQESPSVSGYEDYMQVYPDGRFRLLAKRKLQTLNGIAEQLAAAKAKAKPVRLGMVPTKMIVRSAHWTGDWGYQSLITSFVRNEVNKRISGRGLEPLPLQTQRSSGSWVKRSWGKFGLDRQVYAHKLDGDQGLLGVVIRMENENKAGELRLVYSSADKETHSKRYSFNSELSLKRAIHAAWDQIVDPAIDIVMR